MLDEPWMLAGVVAVVSIMGVIYYLQIRHTIPRRPNQHFEALAFCARCVHRRGDQCTHPSSPVSSQERGPVRKGQVRCEVREVKR